jgi:soluble lytic murein transglycosylase-like protein
MSRLLNCSVITVLLTASALRADSVRDGSATPGESGPEVCQAAVLRNGFTLQYVRPEVAGAATRLYVCTEGGTGYVEIPSEQIERFEQRERTVPLTPEAASAPETTSGGIPPAQASIQSLITSSASRHQVDPDFVASVVKAESGFNPKAVSPKGAQGLMQLMPQTAASLGVKNALDPAANVEGGTKYLRQLLDRYAGDAVKALAAYHAGPQRVEHYGGIPPYRETRAYVARVIDDYNFKKLEQQPDSRAANQ